jgi:hypothetical protein
LPALLAAPHPWHLFRLGLPVVTATNIEDGHFLQVYLRPFLISGTSNLVIDRSQGNDFYLLYDRYSESVLRMETREDRVSRPASNLPNERRIE